MLLCWVQGHPKAIGAGAQWTEILRAAGGYVKGHPLLFTLQVVGVLAATASVVRFSATGPVAGSIAAAWQFSIVLVEAGSLFSWCQSAAMGGAALNGIFGFGLAGAVTAPLMPGLAKRFKGLFAGGKHTFWIWTVRVPFCKASKSPTLPILNPRNRTRAKRRLWH